MVVSRRLNVMSKKSCILLFYIAKVRNSSTKGCDRTYDNKNSSLEVFVIVMNMKKKVGVILTLIILVVIATIAIFLLTQRNDSDDQDRAIQDALMWRRSQVDIVCGQALTQATHTASGTQYTFNDTCLPPGWEAN